MINEQLLLEKWRILSQEKQQKVFEYLETLSTEELAESSSSTFQPKTSLGKKLLELRAKALLDQPPLLTWEELETEIAQRRGSRSEF